MNNPKFIFRRLEPADYVSAKAYLRSLKQSNTKEIALAIVCQAELQAHVGKFRCFGPMNSE